MNRLFENNMKINLSKCLSIEVSYMSFRPMRSGIKPGKDKLKALKTAKLPATKGEIKSFVGLKFF
jgi:hypothetical protein